MSISAEAREQDLWQRGLRYPVGLISDDDLTVLQLATVLETEGFPCAAMVPAGHHEIRTALDSGRWSATVVAMSGPWRDTLDALRPMLADPEAPPCVFIVRGEVSGSRLTTAALRAGVMGIVLMDDLEPALAPTMLAALAGQVVAPRSSLGLVPVTVPVLSHRERQVLAMVARGYPNGQIAETLYLAESTVKSHLTTIFAKLGVTSRNEAAARVLDPQEPLNAAVLASIPHDEPVPRPE
jgi:DNA-binding NarL/FixJ family response regulator